MIEKRLLALREEISESQAVLIKSDINRYYFSGFKSSAGAMIVTKNSAFLLVDFRYVESAKRNVKNLKILMFTNFYTDLTNVLKQENVKEIFLETDFFTVDGFETLRQHLCDFSISKDSKICNIVKQMRSIKDKGELSLIKEAQGITDKAFSHILEYISVGRTEKEIALELEFFMRKSGSMGVAFETISVSGKNSSLPHGVPTDKKLQNGDFLTLDFGAVVDGYCSDMTRTIAVGNVTDEMRKVYDTVLKAQTEALKAVKPNVQCKSIDKIARDIIDDAGFEGCFGHGLGHSVGLEIHETPNFNTRDDSVLRQGMILTVEPGIYIENEFGVRIEDMVYITENGFENLTQSPKELIII